MWKRSKNETKNDRENKHRFSYDNTSPCADGQTAHWRYRPRMAGSGIVLSREVFAFLPLSGGLVWARPLHILSAFWGFVLMALHLGLHWNMILGMIRKMTGPAASRPGRIVLRAAGAAIAGYGLYAFVKNLLLSYMFLTSSFVFFDFQRPVVLFFTEYVGIMGLFVFLAHYGGKWMQKLAGKKRRFQGLRNSLQNISPINKLKRKFVQALDN